MQGRRRGLAAVVAALALVGSASPAPSSGVAQRPEVLVSGLSSPKGLSISPAQDPIVAQGTFGAPGPVVQHRFRAKYKGLTLPITEPLEVVDVAVTADRSGWGLIQGADPVAHLEHRDVSTGEADLQLDIGAYQAAHPDPSDLEGDPGESNPYALAVLGNGDAIVADAAHNSILRVSVTGQVTTVARLVPETVATDHLPEGEQPLPPEIPSEAVPSGLAVGYDGNIYVGELQGFPFRPGTSDVWKIDPDAEEAVCDKGVPDPGCQLFASGYTAIQDVAVDHQGRLYVYQLAADGVLAFEEGFETGVFPSAVLLRIKGSQRVELAAGQLSEPGGVAVGPEGRVYVTDHVFTPDAGRLLRIVG